MKCGKRKGEGAAPTMTDYVQRGRAYLLGKIAAAVGPNVVRQIRAQGPTRPSWRFGPRHVSGRGPRDTYG